MCEVNKSRENTKDAEVSSITMVGSQLETLVSLTLKVSFSLMDVQTMSSSGAGRTCPPVKLRMYYSSILR